MLIRENKYKFYLYGEGVLRNELENYSKQLNIQEHVKFMGFSNEIEKVYNDADLMLFLSDHESFGNVAVECILCGTPVIVSSIPSMKEIFRNYPDFLVDLDNSTAENIIMRMNSLGFLKKKAMSAQKEFYERFSLDTHLNNIKEVYNQI